MPDALTRQGLGRVFKLYIYLCVAKKIPPAPLKKGGESVKVPLFKGDLGGSKGLKTRPKTPWLIAKVLSRGLKAYSARIAVHFSGLELLARSFNSGRSVQLIDNGARFP